MTQLLQINSSLAGERAASTRLADRLVSGLKLADPSLVIVRRDLYGEVLPPLDARRFAAIGKAKATRTVEEAALVAIADELIAEVASASTLVVTAPMYNFAVPSQLKNWFDYLARAGVTFNYTATGPVGLLTGKRAVLVTTRGGEHRGRPQDHVVPYVRTMLAFLGITDLEVIYAEGLALGEAPRRHALARAEADIDLLAARLAA
jgi:FMN-dependent NADH-azoreductase